MLLKFSDPSGPFVVDGALVQYARGEVAGFSERQGRTLLERLDVEVVKQEEVDEECRRRFVESEARLAAKTTAPAIGVQFAIQTLVAGQLYQAGEKAWFDAATVAQI